MTDLMNEELMPLAEAARMLFTRPSLPTLWRWATRGLRGHVLETIAIGGRRLTSREAVLRFVAATNGQTEPAGPPRKTVAQRRREKAAIARELDRAGL